MATTTETPIAARTPPASHKPTQSLEAATVRLCGDSGDGMQLAGLQLTNTSALVGNDVATFPDFPAEIRAPRGTKAGVSGFQIHFANHEIFTPGDQVDALVAMNPAALTTNLCDLVRGGILIVNKDSFDAKGLEQAGYAKDPLADGSLQSYRVFPVEMTKLTKAAVEELGLSQKEADRCKNFFAMGLVFWLYDRPLEPTQRYIDDKFGKMPDIAEANRRALMAGYNYGETTEAFTAHYTVPKAKLAPGTYRSITGNQALAWGLITAAQRSNCELFLGSYPITPASDILHELTRYKNFRRAHLPGRGRNCGDDFRHRGCLRRRNGGNHVQRAGHRAEAGSHRAGGDDRAAGADYQRAARRAEHRAAHQNRAGRFAAGDVRPQRRVPRAGAGGSQSGRLL